MPYLLGFMLPELRRIDLDPVNGRQSRRRCLIFNRCNATSTDTNLSTGELRSLRHLIAPTH